MNTTKGCRKCHFYRGDDINGVCMWFKEYNNEKTPKDIPEHIIIKGCKFFITKKATHLIEVFEGRIIYE